MIRASGKASQKVQIIVESVAIVSLVHLLLLLFFVTILTLIRSV